MATELQKKKMEKVFERFDVDRDGSITLYDIQAMAANFALSFGLAPFDPDWREVQAAALKLWQGLEATAGPDQELSKEEWAAQTESDGFAAWVEECALPYHLAIFDAGDKDKSGALTLDEFYAAQSKTDVSVEEILASFKAMDKDGDGQVTRDEYAKASRDFYLSDDPEAAGSKLAGTVAS